MNFKNKVKSFWDNEAVKVLAVAALSRVAVLLLSLLFYFIKEPNGSISQFIEWLNQTGDVPHYMRIATGGYHGDSYVDPVGPVGNVTAQMLVVFYPLFPMLMKVVGFVVGDLMISGMIISNICAILAAVYMYKLVRLDYSAKTASMAVVFMFLYPFSFFMSFCYTESLFIMLSLMCIYYARTGKWAACGIIGFFGALTRTQGIVLFGVAAYEWVIQTRRSINPKTFGKGIKDFFKALPLSGLFTLLIPAGYGVYLTINKVLFGDWFRFLEYQKGTPWYQTSGFIPDNLNQHLNMAADNPGLAFIIYLPQFIMFIVAFALIFVGVKYKVRTSYLLHIAAYTVASYLSTWLISGGRYMLSCLMMFVPLALLARNKIWRYGLIGLMSALNLFYFYLYIRGYAIM